MEEQENRMGGGAAGLELSQEGRDCPQGELENLDGAELLRQNRELRQELERERREGAIALALARAGAKSVKAARALLEETGNAGDIPDAVERLRQREGWMFAEGPAFTGMNPMEGSAPGPDNPWSEAGWNLTRQAELLRRDRENAARLMEAAGPRRKTADALFRGQHSPAD